MRSVVDRNVVMRRTPVIVEKYVHFAGLNCSVVSSAGGSIP